MSTRRKHGKLSVRFSTGPPKKESEVLSDSSLVMLARHIGQEKLNGLVLAMMLNIPTTNIVNCIYSVTENGLADEDEAQLVAVAEKCVLLWKEMTADVKTKERVKYMERALKEMGKTEIAEVFAERARENLELTPDAFA